MKNKWDQDPGMPYSHVEEPHRKMFSGKKSMTQQESILANIHEDDNSWRTPNPMEPISPMPTNE